MRYSVSIGRFRGIIIIMLAATLGVSSLASCGGSGLHVITFDSRVGFAGAAPVERMLVLADIRSMGFSDAMYDGFEAGMTRVLERCGVRSMTINLDFRGLEDTRKLRASTVLQPNAILVIGRLGGIVTFNTHESFVRANPQDRPATLSGKPGWSSSRLNFELKLLDFKSEKVTWLANVVLDISHGSDVASGMDFANSITSRLQTDEVLKGCPPEVFSPPVDPLRSYHVR